MDELTPYRQLGPEAILQAVEATGRRCDGRLFALNSFENRVYQVGLEDEPPVVVKFYRPARWSDAAIREEHAFSRALEELEIPVVAPLADDEGETLLHHGPYRYTLYPRVGGRPPDVENGEQLRQLGGILGRIHDLGEVRPFVHRPTLTVAEAKAARETLLVGPWIPAGQRESYQAVAADLIQAMAVIESEAANHARGGDLPQADDDDWDEAWDDPAPAPASAASRPATPTEVPDGRRDFIRLHGDFHAGNLLWDGSAFRIVDLDDCAMGPAVQDLWLLPAGDEGERARQWGFLLEGYSRFRSFDSRELKQVEMLRSLRMVRYMGWIARRWDDPAFPRAFPWFTEPLTWERHVAALREQLTLLQPAAPAWNY
ncbi:MAG: serine/threonine protein kinase [Magnetococcales bacterium]|nr:serine/threonine protein kinase [Magnetococcales bacterium]